MTSSVSAKRIRISLRLASSSSTNKIVPTLSSRRLDFQPCRRNYHLGMLQPEDQKTNH